MVRAPAGAVPPWTLPVGAMLSVQLGSALSVPLIEEVGAAGTAWLRLSTGALSMTVPVAVLATAAGLALLFPVLQYALVCSRCAARRRQRSGR